MEPRRNARITNIGIDPSCPKGLHITEYEFDNNCCHCIRYLQSKTGGTSYWYVCKPMFEHDRPPFIPRGLTVWYWTDEGEWFWHTPKQYKTPQEAYDDVKDKI